MTATVRKRGRRSLNGSGESPQLRLRVSEELLEALSRRAALEGVSVSELARGVLTNNATSPRREEQVQLELHRAVLGKLLADSDAIRPIAHRNLKRMRDRVRGPQAQRWLDEWAELIDHPGPDLLEAFLGTGEHSVDLRQVSPFAGVLTDDERLAAIGRASGAAR